MFNPDPNIMLSWMRNTSMNVDTTTDIVAYFIDINRRLQTKNDDLVKQLADADRRTEEVLDHIRELTERLEADVEAKLATVRETVDLLTGRIKNLENNSIEPGQGSFIIAENEDRVAPTKNKVLDRLYAK
jgi:uncharacterized coiled-coil protein SlyX